MKDLLNKLIEVAPYLIIGSILVLLVMLIGKNNLTYDQYIGLVRVLIWPALVLIALLFFRKTFSYLFFSLEEFGFFGTKGNLKDVREVIRAKADELHAAEKREAEITGKISGLEGEANKLKSARQTDSEAWPNILKTTLDLAQKLDAEVKTLVSEKRESQKQIVALLEQIAMLQRHLSSSGGN